MISPKVALVSGAVLLVSLAAGCGKDDPASDDNDKGTSDEQGSACDPKVGYTEDLDSCSPLASDYQPRVNSSADDVWPACISDDNTYHRIDPNVSSIARVAAFEAIAELLWDRESAPSAQDFIDARVSYAQSEGLDSRVQRRHDIHYPAPEGNAKCNEPGVAEAYPDRCVGPSKLLPILNDAFEKGAAGDKPRVQAARIRAALLWFLYVSPLSEITSCASSPKDCDSAWAYYTGGTPREIPAGLAREIVTFAPETHQRAYDALLGVRCWRDLDSAAAATDLTLRDQVRAQLDVAMLRGVALLVRARLLELDCSTGDFQEASLAFVQTLLPWLDRAARAANAPLADVLAAQAAASAADEVDVAAAVSALDALFPCP